MHLLGFTIMGRKGKDDTTISEEVSDEPPEGFLMDLEELYYSFEIITEEEIAALSKTSMTSSTSSSSISSQSSSSSLGSTGTGGPPTVIKAQHHQSQSFEDSEEVVDAEVIAAIRKAAEQLITENEFTASGRIWFHYQIKGHWNPEDDENHSNRVTTEESSVKWTGWLLNLRQLPEKIRQQAADKKRFNINAIPQETRDQLKHLYVY